MSLQRLLAKAPTLQSPISGSTKAISAVLITTELGQAGGELRTDGRLVASDREPCADDQDRKADDQKSDDKKVAHALGNAAAANPVIPY